ncbi:MAG: hypothetical protein ACRDRU_02045 [Pseudonocardiaceae bacterium]
MLVDQVAFELALHADAEERVLYPAMAEAGETDETQRVAMSTRRPRSCWSH